MEASMHAALAVLGAGLGIVIVVLVVGFAWALWRFRAPVRGIRAQWLSARYVFRYDNALEWRGVGGSERRSLTDDLRRNIADAAETEGIEGALSRLGHPRDLAGAIAARTQGPRWAVGGAWALGLWFVFQVATFVGLDALTTGLEQVAPPGSVAVVTPQALPGVTYTVQTGAGGSPTSMVLKTNALTWLVPTLGFVLASRPWRLVTRWWTRRRQALGRSV